MKLVCRSALFCVSNVNVSHINGCDPYILKGICHLLHSHCCLLLIKTGYVIHYILLQYHSVLSGSTFRVQ